MQAPTSHPPPPSYSRPAPTALRGPRGDLSNSNGKLRVGTEIAGRVGLRLSSAEVWGEDAHPNHAVGGNPEHRHRRGILHPRLPLPKQPDLYTTSLSSCSKATLFLLQGPSLPVTSPRHRTPCRQRSCLLCRGKRRQSSSRPLTREFH